MSWIENPVVDQFLGLNISDLTLDQAWLRISAQNTPLLWLYTVSEDCVQCPFQRLSNSPIVPNTVKPIAFKISSQFPFTYRLRTDGNQSIVSNAEVDPWSFCQVELVPGEFGVYDLSVNDSRKCSIQTRLDPVNIYFPLLICVLIYATFAIGVFLVKRYKNGIKKLMTWIFTSCHEGHPSADTAQAPLLPGASTSDVQSSSEDILIRPRTRKKKNKGGVKGNAVLEEIENRPTPSGPSSEAIPQRPVSRVEGQPVPERFSCLDAFRGICIVIMIFVDDNAGLYHFLEHCTWDGLNLADVAFPWFLWIMGVCIPISILSQKKRQTPHFTILKKIISRSVKLVLIGLFIINTCSKPSPVPLGKVRIPGVLQRFGICYFVVSLLVLYFVPEGNDGTGNEQPPPTSMSLLKLKLWQSISWLIVILCVITHSCLTLFLPVPGCPTGYLGPGGLHLNNKYPPHCIGGATGYIDRLLFTTNHIYAWPTSKKVYGSGPFDPEGSLGLLPSILQVWLGVQAGLLFSRNATASKRFKSILVWSSVCLGIGLILCGGPTNKGYIPVNKNLWSLSFVGVTSGLAFLLLAILYWVVDVRGVWTGSPFLEAGSNSMLLYVGHVLFSNSLQSLAFYCRKDVNALESFG